MKVCQPPPPLKPGDLLRVIAPSGALRELAAFQQGVDLWRSHGYKVVFDTSLEERSGYLAGTDEHRRHQLATAWNDPECKGILCARGGYGSARLLENWTWEDGGTWGWGDLGMGGLGDGEKFSTQKSKSKIPYSPNPKSKIQNPKYPIPPIQNPKSKIQNPKWLIGFSDITALLWSLSKIGISGVHAPVLTTIASEPDWSIKRLFNWIEGRNIEPLEGKGWGGGRVNGILLPANLTVATHCLNTPIQPEIEGVILALEDVTEAPYRIDRMLTQWRLTGALQKVKGIALGRFSRCESAPNIPSFSIEEVLRDRLADLGIPIVSELPFGHDGSNAALPVGIEAILDADKGLLICS